MNFSLVAVSTAMVGLLIGSAWLFFGGLLLKRWSVPPAPGALLVGRRLGAVYLGIALILFLGRNAPPSDMRYAVCVGLLFALSAMALLGVYEYTKQRASSGILVSVVLEAVLAAGFSWVLV